MAAEVSPTLRVAMALATFDFVLMSMGRDIIPGQAPFLLFLVVLFVPSTFYYALHLPSNLLKSAKAKRLYAIGMFVGRMALCFYMYIHWSMMADAWARVFGALLVVVPLAFWPSAYWDRTAKGYERIGAVMGVICLTAFLFIDEAPHQLAPTKATAKAGSPNLVLITWDTVRADVLNEYGGTGLDMPNLAAFAEQSITFDDACASTPITAPSHATMLTGLLPPTHGVRSNVFDDMARNVPMLPEILRENGYSTAGFVAAYPLLGRFGFNRGFEMYDDRLSELRLMRLRQLDYFDAAWMLLFRPFIPSSPHAASPGEIVQKRAFDWIAQVPTTEPLFLFEHLYDAHAPNDPVEPRRSKALDAIGTATPLAFDASDNENMALYRAQIEKLDDLLGEMVAELERRDPGLSNTLIILTADHGDCFGEGGYSNNHIASLYEATQHVPMFVRLPGAKGAGTRVPQTVTHYDLLPTFLAQADIDIPTQVESLNGIPLQLAISPNGLSDEPRAVYIEAMSSNIRGQRKRGWRTSDWKLLVWEDGATNLWSYRNDEVVDHGEQQGELQKSMHDNMAEYFSKLPKNVSARKEISEMDHDALKALGYAD